MRALMLRLAASAALVMAVGLARPAPAAACPPPPEARDSGALDEAGAGVLPVELVRAPDEPDAPFHGASDYGRLLILLSVPAAFVGLQIHRVRRWPPAPRA